MSCRWLPAWAPVLLAFVFVGLDGAAPAAANSKYASLVIDAHTGAVIRSDNADARRYPASLTKIMTLYVVFEELNAGRLKKTDKITFSKYASQKPPSKLGIKPGGTITVDNAIRALVTKSANDVAAAVAEHIGGSESAFARRMTETARRLGMNKTTFRNASGLPNAKQSTTARDMVTLGMRVMNDFPEHYSYFSLKSFTWRGKTFRNHNKLLRGFKGTTGIKTGYIRASGFNLVAAVERGDKKIVAVVMGGKTGKRRDAHMRKIIKAAFPKAVAYDPQPSPRAKPMHIAQAFARQVQPAAPVVAAVSASTGPRPSSSEIGKVLLSMVDLPPRSRELPLAETVARGQIAVAAAPAPQPAKPVQVAAATPRLIQPPTAQVAPPPPALTQEPQREAQGSAPARPAPVVVAPAPAATAPAPAVSAPVAPPAVAAFAAPSDDSGLVSMEQLIAAATQASPDSQGGGTSAPSATTPASGRLVLPATDGAASPSPATPEPVRIASTSPRPAAQPRTEPVPDGYQIQVGAYFSPDPVRKLLDKAEKAARGLLDDAHAFTQTAEKGDDTIYRARFAGLDKALAKKACKTLKKRKIDCIVVTQ